MALFEQLKLQYEQGLYTDVSILANMMLLSSESTPDLLTFSTRYQTLVYYADSLSNLKDFKKAEAIYKKALQFRKSVAKSKGKTQPFPMGEVTSEVDVKYKIYLCLTNLKQHSQAAAVLDSIPAKQRTPCINMAIAKLNHQNGNERVAITSYKEVLRESPFAVDAALGLLTLGVKATEVAAMMVNNSLNVATIDWLSLWIKGHSHLHANELALAISTFKQIDTKTSLKDCTEVLVPLGEAHYYNGDFQNALVVLERVHCLDPLSVKGMDVYGILLGREKKTQELENLANHLSSVNEYAPEPWIVMGYHSLSIKKGGRASMFSQKAYSLAPRYIEALLLRGTVLLELKKTQEAITYFGEAYKMCSTRYEAVKGLVDCYLIMHRNREAVAIASTACKQLGQTARALTLYANVLTKDPLSADKAKPLLEKALKQDPTYLNAVFLLASIYEQERLYEKGIELLKKHIEQQTSGKLHQMLGDFLARTNEHEKALQHFSIALNMDPTNHKAAEGSQRVEQNPESSESYDVDEMADSENEEVWLSKEYYNYKMLKT
ncbi:anaphase-promoting complex subunit 7-like isoform X2 [Argiope bruennichi]|uniref:anaphase-promoting complex subunit 7-like isoform X2 n=1 Tax=Argiope bruennichi TaxID=94029 RepID=UPI002494BE12|nr:anaphase-promoting complex subunit 7-like isoform X2 [Argiope bruennichi]